MDNKTKEHILKAGYVIKGLNNLERMKIISLLQKGEMTSESIRTNLKVGKRETLRHLEYLRKIDVVKKKRGKVNLRTNDYTLNSKTYRRYLSCIKKICA